MPPRVAEAFILQTRPLREADKIVSYLTREHGKRRGIAFGARRSTTRFGARLEPLTRVLLRYFENEARDLDRMDSCELMASLAQPEGAAAVGADAALQRTLAAACMVEVADRMLPEHEANETVFRLLATVTDFLRHECAPPATWLGFTYFLLWMARLGGFLPPLRACSACRRELADDEAGFFDAAASGLFCGACRGLREETLSAAGRRLGDAMLHERVDRLAALASLAADAPGRELRRFLLRCLEDHLESRLQSWPLLAGLEGAAEIA